MPSKMTKPPGSPRKGQPVAHWAQEQLDYEGADHFVSVVPHRHPIVKRHVNLGHAKNAVGQPYWNSTVIGGCIYAVEGGEYTLLFEVEPNSPQDNIPWPSRR